MQASAELASAPSRCHAALPPGRCHAALPHQRVDAGSSGSDTGATQQTNAALVCQYTYVNVHIIEYDRISIVIILMVQRHIIKICCCCSSVIPQHLNKDRQVPMHDCSHIVDMSDDAIIYSAWHTVVTPTMNQSPPTPMPLVFWNTPTAL